VLGVPAGQNASLSAPESERPNSYKVFRNGRELPPEELPMQLACAGAPVRDDEIEIVRQDGSRRRLLCYARPLHDGAGRIRGSVGAFLDVTARRRIEEALAQSEARFRQLADFMPQIVWTARPDGYIDYYNERWYQYTGFTRGEYGRQSWEPILHPEDVQRCLEAYFGCIKAERPFQIEYRFKDRKTRGYRWFLGRATPIRDEEGRVIRWFGTCTDIDDTKRAGEKLRDADRKKDEFLATLAHELRNPLAPIQNAVQVLRLEGPGQPQMEHARDMIDRQVAHLVRLVDDLMDVARITSGKINLRRECVSLASIINSAVESSRPLLDARGHALSVSVPPEPMHFNGDATRLAQVFQNLLTNAARYTLEGGRIALMAVREGSDAVVRVTDTGIGIPADMLSAIFEMFTQVDRSLERSTGGLGIGLTLVKELVELHGGRVEARSAGPGQGSEFIVRLPLDIRPHATRESPAAAQALPAGLRILVVDDNRDAADSLAMMLRLLGHEVQTAYDGEEGLTAAELFRPAVALLDIGLPKRNGYELARSIRALTWSKESVLIALTGWGQEEDQRRSHEAGFNHHLVKPANLTAIQALLAAVS
jgi:two-component system CheB/CheR fusion protein